MADKVINKENKKIVVEHLKKSFGHLEVLKDISCEIDEGEVVVVIGPSGSGKSTFLRCINRLEEITGGHVYVDGADMADPKTDLNKVRRHIGMVFQHFNLFPHKTVKENVMMAPVELKIMTKEEAAATADRLLARVGMQDKADAYPSQLSGGQKQRVAIARVLANNPQILLCDEATSALDPQTTRSILELLQHISRNMGITIVVITHEMSVVQQICDRVAVLDAGALVEQGKVKDIFTSPKTEAARRLIIGSNDRQVDEVSSKRMIRIVFDGQSSYEPVIGNVTLMFNTPVNIMYADTKDIGGSAVGEMILQLPDDPVTAQRMIEYLRERKLGVEEL